MADKEQKKAAYVETFFAKLAQSGIEVSTDADREALLNLAAKTRKLANASKTAKTASVSELVKTANAALDKLLNGDYALEVLVNAHRKQSKDNKGKK